MRPGWPQHTALRTEASRACRNIVQVVRTVRGNGPDKRRDPSDQRPAQKKIQKKNAGGVRFVLANNRRQEIKNHEKQETEHGCRLLREHLCKLLPQLSINNTKTTPKGSARLLVNRRAAGELALVDSTSDTKRQTVTHETSQ